MLASQAIYLVIYCGSKTSSASKQPNGNGKTTRQGRARRSGFINTPRPMALRPVRAGAVMDIKTVPHLYEALLLSQR